MFLHLFYDKPYMSDMGYNHSVDRDCKFRIKASPSIVRSTNQNIMAAGEDDVGNQKTNNISEMQLLTLSETESWQFKPEVRVAEFFAKSFGIPIDCWTPCSRHKIFRELCNADRIKYELQCDGSISSCSLTAGELAKSLHDGDRNSFDPYDDMEGVVELSILFVNENPDIQSLDFRCRMNILPCVCEPNIAYCDDNKLRYVERNMEGKLQHHSDMTEVERVLTARNVVQQGVGRLFNLKYKHLDLGIDICDMSESLRESTVWIDRKLHHLPVCLKKDDGSTQFIEPTHVMRDSVTGLEYHIFSKRYETEEEADAAIAACEGETGAAAAGDAAGDAGEAAAGGDGGDATGATDTTDAADAADATDATDAADAADDTGTTGATDTTGTTDTTDTTGTTGATDTTGDATVP